MYDAYRQWQRFTQAGVADNETFNYDIFLLYKEHVAYVVDNDNQTCTGYPLYGDYQPIVIPGDAYLLAQSFIGSSSEPREGVLVNTWSGNLPNQEGLYISTVTQFGCVPVNSMYHTRKYGWMILQYIDNVKGLPDPDQLIPPPFCLDPAKVGFSAQKPVDFLDLFQQMM
ncbi:hypothetical protein NQZ68_017945 [Xyrichtys novacula]|nr:hypothetical protein NQZ68_017945 [Xyrichtys novacula]